jgi:hypothetical protein
MMRSTLQIPPNRYGAENRFKALRGSSGGLTPQVSLWGREVNWEAVRQARGLSYRSL